MISATNGADSQQLRALQRANRVRQARADLKRRVAGGDVTAAEVVLACPWEAAGMEISDLLMSQRRWGVSRCRRLMTSLGLPEKKEIGTLTERQRTVLAAVLQPERRTGRLEAAASGGVNAAGVPTLAERRGAVSGRPSPS